MPADAAALFGVPLVWLTDQPVADREALGLTSHLCQCDRTEVQYVAEVAADQVIPWIGSPIRSALLLQTDLSPFEAGRRPDTWWVATRPIFAVRNRSWSCP